MGRREDKNNRVVSRYDKAGFTVVWHKNSTGNTTKEGHRRISHRSGRVTNIYGKTINKGR